MKKLIFSLIYFFCNSFAPAQSLGLQQLGTLGGELSMKESPVLTQGIGSLTSTIIQNGTVRLDQGFFLACDLPCSDIKTDAIGYIGEGPEMKVFPNPVGDVIQVEAGEDQDLQYVIFNSIGQKVQAGLVENSHIILDSLPAGIYQLKISSAQKRKQLSIKIVKQ